MDKLQPWSSPLLTGIGEDLWSSKEITVSRPSIFLATQSVYFLGIPKSLISCRRHSITVFGKAPFTSRKTATTSSPRRHAFLVKFISMCSESVVVHPGRPPNCSLGSNWSFSV